MKFFQIQSQTSLNIDLFKFKTLENFNPLIINFDRNTEERDTLNLPPYQISIRSAE